MQALARRLVRRPVAWAVVILTGILTVVGGLFAGDVRQEDDLLAFLPEGNAEIEQFRAIADAFGGLDVALVGIESDDVFAPEFLESLAAATHALKQTPGVDRVLSLSNVQDFVEDPIVGGVAIVDLVDRLPHNDAEQAALRAKVLSRDHVTGVLVSEDGRAVQIYCFLAWGSEPRLVAEAIRDTVRQAFPTSGVYFGGAPFINTWIYETTQRDLRRLVPWAILAIVVIMLLSFRDWLAAGLGLYATGVGILVARGTMGFLDVPDNLVLSSMPVILFAVGSAYSIHIISRFYANLPGTEDVPEAVVRTLLTTGPTVLAAGGTTVVGLLSFVVMDIEPMRVFGVFTALGVFVAMIVAVTFVPAVLVLRRPRVHRTGPGWVERWTAGSMAFVMRHKVPFGVVTGALIVVGAGYASRVDHRMDEAAFFSPGSPPAEATAFMTEHFGGSQFFQVLVEGDISDPHVLREVQRVTDRLAALDGVADIQSVPAVLALVNRSMTGVQRVPDTRDQAGVLFGFLTGDPSVDQLITSERDQALLMVKVSATDVDALERVEAEIRKVLAEVPRTSWTVGEGPEAQAWLRDVAATRITAAARDHGGAVPDPAALGQRLAGARPKPDPAAVRVALGHFLGSEENWVPLETLQVEAVAAAVAGLGPDPGADALTATVTGALGPGADPMTVDDLSLVLETPVAEAWRIEKARALADALAAEHLIRSGKGLPLRDATAAALLDLDLATGLVPAEGPEAKKLGFVVSGQPVLYGAMSRSVQANQIKSLVYALVLVGVILSLLFGSPWAGLLAAVPMLVTLLLVYGAMGAMGVRLDIGTSMIASLVIGAGVDYAVHLLAAWHPDGGLARPGDPPLAGSAREAAHETATAVWTNAAMVAAGFYVLTLGEARPLQNVGSLVSAAMIVAACSTFLVIPLLARRPRYGR